MEQNELISAVQRNSNRLYRIALSFTKNHHWAEDVVQNTFLKLMKQNRAFESEGHLDNWLTSVCVNECKDHLKSFFRKNGTSLEDAGELYTFDRPKDIDLFNAVMSLPKNERTVIHLFYHEELSIREIAILLKIRESAVGTRLHRARKHLKEKLGDDWINE
jgi:RNA polymerase sigma-70 factor (ECF subfamily)